jgi:hypothetical protein
MDIISVLKGKIKIKVSIKPIVSDLVDKVLEPALEKVVQDSKNPLDNILKAAIAPALEAEIKRLAGEQVDKLSALIPESLKDIIEIE